MNEKKRVLVVDDEDSIVGIVRYALEEAGYEVASASDAERGREVFDEFHPDLVILDVMLPGQSGLDFCRELRQVSDVPVLMLSARSEEIDRILGLELGADDYVTKPFSPRELVSRVKANLRRAEAPAVSAPSDVHIIGDLKVDGSAHQVFVAGEEVALTHTEFQILEQLARAPGRVFTRLNILDNLWDGGFVGDERAVDVHVHNIREKVEADPAHPEYLQTVRGVGYRLRGA